MKNENENKITKICEVLGISTDFCSWDDVMDEIHFIQMKSKFGYVASTYKVSGGVAILCTDFGFKEPDFDTDEKQALECLLEEVERFASDRRPHIYGRGICTQTLWTQGQWVDFRNVISEIIEILGDEKYTSDLSCEKQEKIHHILWNTPVNREHYKF